MDYDLRGQDLRQAYARFGRIPLSDAAVWSLSLAQSVVNESLPQHMGYQAWITDVAGVDSFAPELTQWACALADTFATVKPKLKQRSRLLVENYSSDWGHSAALDGVKLALFGKLSVPSVRERAEQHGCKREAYQRIRNLIAGCLLLQAWQFEDALGWAVRLQRRAA